MKLYTRSGDEGKTSLGGGRRVSKFDPRIEANGALDELEVAIGIVRAYLPEDHEWQTLLAEIQTVLMTSMARVATPHDQLDNSPYKLPEGLIASVEQKIDQFTDFAGESTHFLLPAGNPISAFLHQCRVTARNAERRLWAACDVEQIDSVILCYVNRLSDLFFIMARIALTFDGSNEECWTSFIQRKK